MFPRQYVFSTLITAGLVACLSPAVYAEGAMPSGTIVGAQTTDDVSIRPRLEEEIKRLKAEKQAKLA